ncbi:MAG TPA: alpha-glucan family phosphorylase [Steroidobacteraceae bacterium]|nr:alpha-glucan family phosphorylase [Steroidobacteraceae bacterium]
MQDGFELLAQLALDLRPNDGASELWRALDPALWDSTRNGWMVLQSASRDWVNTLLAQPRFRAEVERLGQARREAISRPAWFQQAHPQAALHRVAYFSMEFMLSEALPIYSGGLGNVAGDQLKSGGDLGVPVVGVGLLYQQGYFRQVIDRAGGQQALYPYNDPGQLPITPVRAGDGQWLRVQVELPGPPVWLRAWKVQVGRAQLYLLDSNDLQNYPAWRSITAELYGGGPEMRLRQELVLGVGGWRLLKALGLRPDVCHLNEGHAAFAVLERAADFMAEADVPFETALTATRAGNLFTTHTAVPAGFDRFAPALIEQYLSAYARERLGLGTDALLALGRTNPGDWSESFNMAWLAIRGSGAVNGVSRLHGRVSRQIFQPLFPRWPEHEVPVGHVTNGVHVPTWASAAARALRGAAQGPDLWETAQASAAGLGGITDVQLWEYRNRARAALIGFARARLAQQLTIGGGAAAEVAQTAHLLDPNALTLGFARRFATYKRPNLLLKDTARLLRLLANAERPVQIIIAGKAHPADQPGQALVRQWIQFIRGTEARNHVIFLADYDMQLAAHLVQGVDVWVNTPRRPWEACGTSGMKVLVNGGVNLSQLDGWWAEAFEPAVGWALGDAQTHGEDPAWDEADANALYATLEREVVPQFYQRDAAGVPAAWLIRMRASMSRLTPQFSSGRAVREYTERYYVPAAQAVRARTADGARLARELAAWREALDRGWARVRFGAVSVAGTAAGHDFEVEVFLGGLDPGSVSVQLYADGREGAGPEVHDMAPGPVVPTSGAHLFAVHVPAGRPAGDYTARVVARHQAARAPLEAGHILWQR